MGDKSKPPTTEASTTDLHDTDDEETYQRGKCFRHAVEETAPSVDTRLAEVNGAAGIKKMLFYLIFLVQTLRLT